MYRNLWVENADRLVAGFLEMFEERCHKMVSQSMHKHLQIYRYLFLWLTNTILIPKMRLLMIEHTLLICLHIILASSPNNFVVYQGTAIRDHIQERLRGQLSGDSTYLLYDGSDNSDDNVAEEYYDEDDDGEYYYDEEECAQHDSIN